MAIWLHFCLDANFFFHNIKLNSNGYLVALLQRFYMVKPCPKEMKCDVEVGF